MCDRVGGWWWVREEGVEGGGNDIHPEQPGVMSLLGESSVMGDWSGASSATDTIEEPPTEECTPEAPKRGPSLWDTEATPKTEQEQAHAMNCIWTKAEDELLLTLVTKYDLVWSRVAAELPGRVHGEAVKIKKEKNET